MDYEYDIDYLDAINVVILDNQPWLGYWLGEGLIETKEYNMNNNDNENNARQQMINGNQQGQGVYQGLQAQDPFHRLQDTIDKLNKIIKQKDDMLNELGKQYTDQVMATHNYNITQLELQVEVATLKLQLAKALNK